MAEKSIDAEARVREIRRKTRRRYSSEEKIRIVLEGLKGEESIAELCRREGISPNLYYNWSKEFLEAGKRRLMGDTKREASRPEVSSLRDENVQLKQLVAELSLRNRMLKKSLSGLGELDPETRTVEILYKAPPSVMNGVVAGALSVAIHNILEGHLRKVVPVRRTRRRRGPVGPTNYPRVTRIPIRPNAQLDTILDRVLEKSA